MSISPYLSDTVLIAFMTHTINKPAHKKNVVLANSPLPYNVRPYIDLMNINQNFKNQLWAAQDGMPNARVLLEQEISSLDFQRNAEINELALSSMNDSLGYQTDSLIDYLANSAYLSDHILRYSLLFGKSDIAEAENELAGLNTYTFDLSSELQLQYNEFTDVAYLNLDVVQLEDSIADSLIYANETLLQSVANTEFHVAQNDAKLLLEQTDQQQVNYVWLPYGTLELKKAVIGTSPDNFEEIVESYVMVFPNPSDGNFTVELPENSKGVYLTIANVTGQIIDIIPLNNEQTIYHYTGKLPSGTYFIGINNSKKTIVKKLIVK